MIYADKMLIMICESWIKLDSELKDFQNFKNEQFYFYDSTYKVVNLLSLSC